MIVVGDPVAFVLAVHDGQVREGRGPVSGPSWRREGSRREEDGGSQHGAADCSKELAGPVNVHRVWKRAMRGP